jgi:hypothetical protein
MHSNHRLAAIRRRHNHHVALLLLLLQWLCIALPCQQAV